MIKSIGKLISFITMASVLTPGSAWIVSSHSGQIETSIRENME